MRHFETTFRSAGSVRLIFIASFSLLKLLNTTFISNLQCVILYIDLPCYAVSMHSE